MTFTKDSTSGLWKAGAAFGGPHSFFNNGSFVDLPTLAKGSWVKIDKGVNGTTMTAAAVEATRAKVTTEKNAGSSAGASTTHELTAGDATLYDYSTLQGVLTNAATSYTKMLDNTYDFIVVNGFFWDADKVESGSTDVLFITGESAADGLNGKRIKAIFADGTEEIITVSKYNSKKVADNISGGDADNSINPDQLWTYKKASDGTYEITKVSSSNLAGNNLFVEGLNNFWGAATNQAAVLYNGTTYATIADSAVIFVKDTSDGTKYSMISGATLKSYSSLNTISDGAMLVKDGAAQVAWVSTNKIITKENTWAFLTGAPSSAMYNGTEMTKVSAFLSSSKSVEEIYINATANNFSKRDIIKLQLESSGAYSYSGDKAVLVAVTKWDASDKVVSAVHSSGKFYADTYSVDDSTVYLNVDYVNASASIGDATAIANRDQYNRAIANAYMFVNGDEEVKVIATATNNNANQSATTYTYCGMYAGDIQIEKNTVGFEASPYNYNLAYDTVVVKAGDVSATFVSGNVATSSGTDAYSAAVGVYGIYGVAGDTITYTVKWVGGDHGNRTGTYDVGGASSVNGVYLYAASAADTRANWVGSNEVYKAAADITVGSSGTFVINRQVTDNIAANGASEKITFKFAQNAKGANPY